MARNQDEPWVIRIIHEDHALQGQLADENGVARELRVEGPGRGCGNHGASSCLRGNLARSTVYAIAAACIRGAFRRYKAREVGGGRATRQPGQVRKEAALTSSGSGRSSASHLHFCEFAGHAPAADGTTP